MDTLRIILIILGVAAIIGIYFWDKYKEKAPPDRYSSPDPDDPDAQGLVITTKTKFNEEDLVSELADLNHFMVDRKTQETTDDDLISSIRFEKEPENATDGTQGPVDDVDSVSPAPDDVSGSDKYHNQNSHSLAEHLVVLHLVAPADELFTGLQIENAASGQGFEFGAMNIFHYQDVDLAGNMQTLFSLVNMFEPGYFEPEGMDGFSTRGISVFATLKNDGSDVHVFDTMLDITRQIAGQLNAEIWGPDKSPLCDDVIGKIVSKLREAE